MKRIVPVITGVIKKNNTYLLTKRKDGSDDGGKFNGYWQFPGGAMEFAESPEETLHREIREETGIEVEITALLPRLLTEVRSNWQGLFICYICRMKNENDRVVLNDEASDYGWFRLDEIKTMQTLPFTYEVGQLSESL